MINNINEQYSILQKNIELILDEYKCMICLEVAKFPVTYQCSKHIACHTCIHKWFNSNKEYSNDIGYYANIFCSLCEHITKATIATDIYLDPLKPMELFTAKIKQGFDPENKRAESVCPYCNIDISVNTNYNHVYKCSKRTIDCHNCKTSIVINNIDIHLDEVCKGFACKECKNITLTRKELFLHKKHNYLVKKNVFNTNNNHTFPTCKIFINSNNNNNNNNLDLFKINKFIKQYLFIDKIIQYFNDFLTEPNVDNLNNMNKSIIIGSSKIITEPIIDIDLIKSILSDNNNNNNNNNHNNNNKRFKPDDDDF